ncbi:MAG: MltA domain-containing protein [Bacteroidota bacterium]
MRHLTLLILLAVLWACDTSSTTPLSESDYVPLSQDSLPAQTFSKKGKLHNALPLSAIYTPIALDTFQLPIVDGKVVTALQRQRRLLHKKRQRFNRRVGDLRINLDDLTQTVDILESWQHLIPVGMEKELKAHQVWGKDHRGNVKFTAYFAPVIQVSKKPTAVYKYPIRATPKGLRGQLPDRRAIEAGAIDSITQHLAYARSKTDIYYMQLQGSGYVEYADGSRELFAYAGENRHPYRSIESYLATNSKQLGISNVSMQGVKRYLEKRPDLVDSVLNQNPSYTFFRRRQAPPTGAGHVPLTEGMSIAVDKKYIPLGSCLLAAVPILDEDDKVIGHEMKYLFAQDVGGAIKGSGRVDVYFGAGADAERKANSFNAYGRMWLLLPKQQPMPMILASK